MLVGLLALAMLAGSPAKAEGHPASFQLQSETRIELVRKLLRSGQYESAIAVAGAEVRDHPTDLRAQFFLGIALHKSKRYAEALKHLEATAAAPEASFPEAAHAVHFLAWGRYYLGDLAGARAAFIQHINAFPNYDDSHFGLGLVAYDEDRIVEAEQCFRRALELLGEQDGAARERAKNLARLGDVLLRQERLVEAEVAYRRAVELWEDHYEAWAKLARVLDRLERPAEAELARAKHTAVMVKLGKEVAK